MIGLLFRISIRHDDKGFGLKRNGNIEKMLKSWKFEQFIGVVSMGMTEFRVHIDRHI